jgi:hypothetical protein
MTAYAQISSAVADEIVLCASDHEIRDSSPGTDAQLAFPWHWPEARAVCKQCSHCHDLCRHAARASTEQACQTQRLTNLVAPRRADSAEHPD